MLDATKCFRVSGIRLVSALFETAPDVSETLIDNENCTGQTKRLTVHKFVERLEGDEALRFLLATVSLGFRLVSSDDVSEEPGKVYYTIQASFVAEFEVRSAEFDEASLEQFVQQNAAHVVWPFWRHHVYSTLQAASLPAVAIPLMAAVSRPKKATPDAASAE